MLLHEYGPLLIGGLLTDSVVELPTALYLIVDEGRRELVEGVED
jgi:hypothetical protein